MKYLSDTFDLPFQCDLPFLRSLNVVGGSIVFPLLVIYPLFKRFPSKIWISNIVLFPLITIYFNLFYTDVWSTLFIIGSFVVSYLHPFGFTASSLASALLAFISLWFRQTNVIWTAFNLAILIDQKVLLQNGYQLEPIEAKYKTIFSLPAVQWAKAYLPWLYALFGAVLIFIDTTISNILISIPFFVNFALFAAFLVINGGITFGDKDNHISTIHFAQLYYCVLFMGFFGWPLFTSYDALKNYVKFNYGSVTRLISTLVMFAGIAGTIKYFTIVHPFLLADNRHYTFYLWRRVIGRSELSKYALIPLYHLLGYLTLNQFKVSLPLPLPLPLQNKKTITNDDKAVKSTQTTHQGSGNNNSNSVIVLLAFICCVCISIIPSPLFEPRYYILPYLYWRLLIEPESTFVLQNDNGHKSHTARLLRLGLEFFWYLVIDAVVLMIFIKFEFKWASEPDVVQRIIW